MRKKGKVYVEEWSCKFGKVNIMYKFLLRATDATDTAKPTVFFMVRG